MKVSCQRIVENRDGVTLFEILLATAILSISMAALSRLAETGIRSGLRSQLEGEAMLLCHERLQQELSHTAIAPQERDEHWTFEVSRSGYSDGLTQVTVRATRGNVNPPFDFELTRLVRSSPSTQTRRGWR